MVVLLKPAPVFAQTRPEDVFGALPRQGKPKTIEEMDVSIPTETKRRDADVIPELLLVT